MKPEKPFPAKSLRYLVLAVAARQHDLHVVGDAAQRGERLDSIHARHREIENHARNRPEMGAKDLERFDSVRGEEHAEAEMLEHAFRDGAHHFLVVDEKHRSVPPPSGDRRGAFVDMFDRARRRGEDEPESGAFPRFAADSDRPAVPSHDAENDGEPEPPPRGLRREERVEYLPLRFLVHSASRIGHLEKYVPALGQPSRR